MNCVLLLTVLLSLSIAVDPQITAVYGLIERVASPVPFCFYFDLQEVAKKFTLDLIPSERDGKDIFQIDATTDIDRVTLRGTDGSMLAYAFGQQILLVSLILDICAISVIQQPPGVKRMMEIMLRFLHLFLL